MTQWNDLFLRMPLPESWQNGLLFVSFGLHLLFVLLMLGTALLGLLFFLQKCLTGEGGAQLWNKQIVHTHLGLKSLAVVLGVSCVSCGRRQGWPLSCRVCWPSPLLAVLG